MVWWIYSPFCVTAKVTKLVGHSPPLFLSPMNLVTFAGTQNGQFQGVLPVRNQTVQVKIKILIWTCLLILLKYIEKQEQSGQVQFRIVIFTCIDNHKNTKNNKVIERIRGNTVFFFVIFLEILTQVTKKYN
jgi:hypothetical protein